jgi:hypothetical protein
MVDYKYELQKGSKHTFCPNCKKKTFKPFVYIGTDIPVDKNVYGRCERINTCKYFHAPDKEKYISPSVEVFSPVVENKKPDFISHKIMEQTFHNFRDNNFFRYLVRLFGQDAAFSLQEKYNIGTAKNGGTIFWQVDKENNIRTGKVFYYNMEGKRNKEIGSWYLHKKINPKFNLVQVFFGEHLLPDGGKIALCESEKTAILMSIYKPEYTWIAAGGSQMLNLYRLSRIPNIDIIFPDQGQFIDWEKKTSMFKNRVMDKTIEIAYNKGLVSGGSDIFDLIISQKQKITT